MKLRKIIFWLHLTAGLMAGTIIFVMSATGVLLAFERQIVAYVEREARAARPAIPDAPRLSLDTLVANAREAVPDGQLSNLTLSADPTVAAIITMGREQTVLVDPYTGAVRQGATTLRSFFHTVTDWHRWLGTEGETRDIGRAITGACNTAFAVLLMSGFYLWWPRRWTRVAIKAVTIPRLKLQGKPRDWNWHNVAGFWSASVLLLITVTGVVMSYQWAGNLLYILTGSEAPTMPQRPLAGRALGVGAGRGGSAPGPVEGIPDGRTGRQPRADGGPAAERQGRTAETSQLGAASGHANLDALVTAAVQQTPHWRLINMRLPQRDATQMTIMIEEASRGIHIHVQF
jgi:uncharacterized iron-regulated membrane protein